MPHVNLIAVLLCGVASLLLGGLWYSPMLFAKPGNAPPALATSRQERQHGGDLRRRVRAQPDRAYVFGMFLGQYMPLAGAVGAGFSAGLCWVGAAFGINYLFERRPFGLWAINAGYHTLQFTCSA